MEILEKLFGSAARVKMLRLFVLNPGEVFDFDQVINRAKVDASEARREIHMMERIGLLRKKSFFKDVEVGKGKKMHVERHRVAGWTLDEFFSYREPLEHMLVHINPNRNTELLTKLQKVGKLKLVIISGLFIQNWDSRIDLLIVGDLLKKGTLENVIKTIESEIGKEIRYTAFETADFQYRLGIYDKLIRDILDFPHEKILDKIGLAPQRP